MQFNLVSMARSCSCSFFYREKQKRTRILVKMNTQKIFGDKILPENLRQISSLVQFKENVRK